MRPKIQLNCLVLLFCFVSYQDVQQQQEFVENDGLQQPIKRANNTALLAAGSQSEWQVSVAIEFRFDINYVCIIGIEYSYSEELYSDVIDG